MDQLFRIAGMVEENSLTREDNNLTVQFVVTDTVKTTPVRYTGNLPDLFKEGQGTVAGVYVWSGFGITALLMVAEVVILRSHRQTTIKRLRRIMRVNKHQDSTS